MMMPMLSDSIHVMEMNVVRSAKPNGVDERRRMRNLEKIVQRKERKERLTIHREMDVQVPYRFTNFYLLTLKC